MAKLGAFVGGLAGGYAAGRRLSMEEQEAEERKKDRELQRERAGLELGRLKRGEESESAYHNWLREQTHEPVQQEDAAGNITTSSRPRDLSMEDWMDLGSRSAQKRFELGMIKPEELVDSKRKMDVARREGMVNAAGELLINPDDPKAIASFERTGRFKFFQGSKPMVVDEPDPYFKGLTRKKVVARINNGSPDGAIVKLDPMEMAYTSTLEGLREQHKLQYEGARVAAADRSAAAREKRDDERHQENLRMIGARETQANAAMVSANARASGKGGKKSLFETKLEWLDENMPNLSSEEKYAYASGQRRVPAQQIQRWVNQDLAAAERANGTPFAAQERARRRRALESEYSAQWSGDGGSGGGAAPPGLDAARPNPSRPGGGVDLNRFLIGR